MPKRRIPLYVEVKSPSEISSEIASIALFQAGSGTWFYAEVVDFDRSECTRFFVESVLPKMKRIPGTKFVTKADLPGEVLRWLISVVRHLDAQQSGGQEIVLRAQTRHSADLAIKTLVNATEAAGVTLVSTVRICRPDAALLSDFYSHSGGEAKARHNGLADAVGLAICDQSRVEKVNLTDIRHFEFLMGSKPAMSLRAWVRRLEAAKFASPTGRDAVAGAGAAI